MIQKLLLSTALAASLMAGPALAQSSTSTSGSNAGANASNAAQSNANNANTNGQSQSANNAGIGNSTSTSGSSAGAVADTHSSSVSTGNTQGQGQTQGQMQSTTTGQTASNNQGVSVTNQFNSTQLKRTYVGTNTAVPLVASSSFSSDYCGGTISGGASVAPIGVSIGASGPKMDDSCQYLRVAEKAGMMAANWANMHQDEMALKEETLGSWATCMAGPRNGKHHRSESETAQVCMALGLMGSAGSAASPPPVYVPPAPVTPPEAVRAAPPPEDYSNLPPKTPRGENTITVPVPVISPTATPNGGTAMATHF